MHTISVNTVYSRDTVDDEITRIVKRPIIMPMAYIKKARVTYVGSFSPSTVNHSTVYMR